MPAAPVIQAFFDEPTNTVSYLVADPTTKEAAVVDPVLGFEQRSGTYSPAPSEAILAAASAAGFKITWILETHAHADHLSGAPVIQARTGAAIGIGEHISAVQRTFSAVFNLADVSGTGGEFGRLFRDGERFALGKLAVEVLHLPGHTPACVAYKIADAVFVGDTLFMPDYGTARCDFPGGDARTLFRSVRRLLSLPPETRLFMCHDYKAPGRDRYAWETTVAAQRAANPHVKDGITEDAFVAMREARDATLPVPALLLPSIQVNIRAGRLPPPEANGVSYLKLPLAPAKAASVAKG